MNFAHLSPLLEWDLAPCTQGCQDRSDQNEVRSGKGPGLSHASSAYAICRNKPLR